MIEMKCPACGAEGRVPKEKVNTRLVCRKCLKAFHVTATGRAVPGEPLPSGSTSSATADDLADRANEVDQWFERLYNGIVSRRTLYYGLGFVLLVVAITWLSSRHVETLEERVTKVAQAALTGDVRTVTASASDRTQDDTLQWYQSIRPQCDELKQRLGSNKLRVDVEVNPESNSSDTVDVVARLSPDERLERKAGELPDPSITLAAPASSQTMSLPMTWKSETWSGWRLDGRRTLLTALSGPGQPAGAAPKNPDPTSP